MIRRAFNLLAAIVLTGASAAHAGPYTDDLSKCAVESTTAEDRVDLVRWMFAAASSHPAVKPISSVSAETLDQANQKMAGIVMRVLTESCRAQAEKAVKYEGGAVAIQTSFQMLGQVAGQELCASPEVATAMNGMEKYIDATKLEALGKAPQ